MPRKAAQGTGTIRKRTLTHSGKAYTYWKARSTAGTDPGTGRHLTGTVIYGYLWANEKRECGLLMRKPPLWCDASSL